MSYGTTKYKVSDNDVDSTYNYFDDYSYESISGVRGDIYCGFEALRISDKRVFFQLNTTLPFYTIEDDNGKNFYSPLIKFTINLGL